MATVTRHDVRSAAWGVVLFVLVCVVPGLAMAL